MSDIVLHNTLTGRKEPFRPMQAGRVGLYVCGITPYDESHLGHARCYVVFDLLKRVLKNAGYTVFHVQNFTDVDDKIIDRANQKGVSALDYPKPFMESYKALMARLNVLPADEYPLVTTHISDIIALIGRLVERGLAYEMDGNVQFSVRDFAPYGRLSKRNIDDLKSGARVDVNERKRDPLDFALWKKAKPGEPSWPSPWGAGRPGWHIECSAMSMKYLGEEFDIHGGGMDLIFPHHENEVAQSCGASGAAFARTWVHNGFVTVDAEKMSKSLGNFFTIRDILAKYDPMVVRYFLLTKHYRGPLNFSDHELDAARATWERVAAAHRLAREQATPAPGATAPQSFIAAMADDLNTPAALAELNGVCGRIYEAARASSAEKALFGGLLAQLNAMFDVLGLVPPADEAWPQAVLDLVARREAARKAKDWAASDALRAELTAIGVAVKDTPAGPKLTKVGP